MTIDLLALVADARSLRPHTKRAYDNAVRQWLAFAGGEPSNWTAAAAQAFYDQLLKRVSVATANGILTGGVSFALKRAHALGFDVRDVTVAVDKAPVVGDGEQRHALTPTQARALVSACNGTRLIDLRDRALTLLGLYTGMRRMSLVTVDQRRVGDHGSYVVLRVPIKGKGGTYDVPLDVRAWSQLRPYREALAYAAAAAGANRPPAWLFPSIGLAQPSMAAPLGEVAVGEGHITEDGLYRALRKRAEAAKIGFHPHLFRHTFATWCLQAGIPDGLVEVVTGHKGQRSMVESVYKDKDAMKADVSRRCYEAIRDRLTL